MKLPFHPLLLAPVALGLAVAGGAGGYFVYEMGQLSWLAGGSEYSVKLPPLPAKNTKAIPQCGANVPVKWLGCF